MVKLNCRNSTVLVGYLKLVLMRWICPKQKTLPVRDGSAESFVRRRL